MPSYSVAKSVTSAAVGILARDGRLDPDDPAPVPEWHADPDDPRNEITIEHMLHMASGMPWRDDFTKEGTEMYELVRSDDAGAYAAAQLPTAPPGTRFTYNSGTSTLLARMVGDAVGNDADDTRAFLEDELFSKIGMDPVRTRFDAAGTWLGRVLGRLDGARLRQVRPPLPPRGRVGRRADPRRGLGGAHAHAQPRQPGVRRPVVARLATARRLLRRSASAVRSSRWTPPMTC